MERRTNQQQSCCAAQQIKRPFLAGKTKEKTEKKEKQMCGQQTTDVRLTGNRHTEYVPPELHSDKVELFAFCSRSSISLIYRPFAPPAIKEKH